MKDLIEKLNYIKNWKCGGDSEMYKTINDAISALETLTPIQPEPKWISVSDRLPEEDGYYIVTDDSGGAAWVVYSFFCRMDDGEPWWEYTNVTAWMEKPSPYKGE